MTQYPSTAARISSIITTTATWTPINIGFEVPEGSVSKIDLKVVASDYGNNNATWTVGAVVRRYVGESPVIVAGNTYSITKLASGAATWDVRLAIYNELVRVDVLGEAGRTIDWIVMGQDPVALYGSPALDALTELTVGLSSYWNLDESSGIRLDSITFSNNNLTDNNTVTSAAGKVGTAASFVAANSEYLSCPSTSSLQTGDIDFTLTAWVNYATVAGVGMIIGKDDVLARDYFMNLESDGRASFAVFVGATPYIATTAANIGGSAWHLLIGERTGTTINLYVDNALSATQTIPGAPNATSSTFSIGSRTYPAFQGYFDGLIDEVGFWKRLLTADEKTTLYNNGLGLTYPFTM